MPVDEILPALKNAVDRGESLQSAMQTLVNSGYNPSEVQEASKFIRASPINLEVKKDEHLLMPSEKSFFHRFKKQPQKSENNNLVAQKSQIKSLSQTTEPYNSFGKNQQYSSDIQQNNQIINSPRGDSEQEDLIPLARQPDKLDSKKRSYSREIILLIVLLILIGVLILTIVFRKNIIGLF